MKTLADLKRNADKYEWKLLENSWFERIPPHQKEWRRVSRTMGDKFALETIKDGEKIDSWVSYPRSTELEIIDNEDATFDVIIARDCGANKPSHIMHYKLKPITQG